MTARRLLLTVVAGALALGGLAGCRSQPGIAAYVGDTKFTEVRVDEILTDAREKLAAAAQQPTELPISRQDVVVALVGRQVMAAAAERDGLSPAEVPIEAIVQQVQLPEDAEFTRITQEYWSYRTALSERIAPREPSEADLNEVFTRLVAVGGLPDGASFADFRASLSGQNLEVVSASVALRDVIAREVSAGDVAVNPRYGTAELELLSIADQQGRPHPLMVVPLDARPDSAPVVERD